MHTNKIPEDKPILPAEFEENGEELLQGIPLEAVLPVQTVALEIIQVEETVTIQPSAPPLQGRVTLVVVEVAAAQEKEEAEKEEEETAIEAGSAPSRSTHIEAIKPAEKSLPSESSDIGKQQLPKSPDFVPTLFRLVEKYILAQALKEAKEEQREAIREERIHSEKRRELVKEDVKREESQKSDEKVLRHLEGFKNLLMQEDLKDQNEGLRNELESKLFDEISFDEALFALWNDQIFFEGMADYLKGQIGIELRGKASLRPEHKLHSTAADIHKSIHREEGP